MDANDYAHDGGAFIALASELQPGNLQISSAVGDPIVTIHYDGRVEVNPKYQIEEAARAFWDAVIALNPLWQQGE